MSRTADISRKLKETSIRVALNLDGAGNASIKTGVEVFDHMLELLARHSLIDLTVETDGTPHVDAHHVIESIGIIVAQAIETAVGDKPAIFGDGWSEAWTNAWHRSRSTSTAGRRLFSP